MGAGGKGRALPGFPSWAGATVHALIHPLPTPSLHAFTLIQFGDCYMPGILMSFFWVVSFASVRPLVPPSMAYHIRPLTSDPNPSVQPFLHLAFQSLLERLLFVEVFVSPVPDDSKET